MTNRKSTKKALLVSGMSLLICFTMLIGTTFAWFTDSVTSANNIIKSGNLDIELEYWDGDSWEDVSGKSDILTNTLWEPGTTEVAYLRVANAGSLALKYQLGINIVSEKAGVNAAGESFKLSDYIQFGVVESVNGESGAYANRDAAVAAVTNAKKISAGYTKADSLAADAAPVYLALVVYMPTTVGNEANHKTSDEAANPDKYQPQIDLGINLFATQYTAENDSFGSDYDKDAIIASAPVAIPTEDVTTPVTLNAADVAVEVPAAVINALPAEVTSIALTYTEPEVDATNNTVTFATVELVDQNGNKIDLSSNTEPIAVTLPAQTTIAANEDVVILHDGEAVASATVATDGSISYEANHFCEVAVVAVTKVGTADELKAAVAAGENVQFTADITISSKLVIVEDTAIFGFGKTLTYTGADRAINVDTADEADLTIDGLTLNCTASFCERGINYNDSGKLTLNNVTVTGANINYAINLPASSDNANVTINDCDILGNIALNVWGENAVIVANNTDFRSDYVSDVEACPVIKINMDNSGNIAQGTTVTVNGGSVIAVSELVAIEVVAPDVTLTVSSETTVKGSIDEPIALIVYEGQSQFYTTPSFARAIERAKNDPKATIVLIKDLKLTQAVTIDGAVKLDLNGHTISGTCTASQGYLFMVNNGAKLTVLDSSEAQTGKITFAQGTSNVGWAIDLEGELVLESGTIELTGDSWSIGYCVDVRPNAWGTAYTNPTVFTMNGGKVVSSDGAIRVASSSSEIYTGVSAKFVMNGGEVEAAWDGIFVQQSDAIYDILTVELNGGKVASALSPVRVYGPVATSVVGGAEKPMTLTIGANAELSVNGEIDTSRTWYKDGVVVLGGGMTVEALEQYTTITIAE